MDTELVAYLDRRFDELSGTLSAAIRTGDDETRRVLRDEIRTGDDETRRVLRDEIRAGDEESRRVLGDEIRAGDEESRRHMGVLTESLVSQIQLVAEGVVVLSERVDRLETNFKGDFEKIDRHLLHLTAQLSNRRRSR